MRKQTKLVAVLSAAALLAIGASMTSFAATKGWAEEDGTWVYLDSDGDRVTDTWKKSGSQYFYLNEDGEMAVSSIVEDGEDRYYVDVNGARVTNQWVSVDNEDGDEIGGNDVENIWYYFSSTGKAYDDSVKTINDKKYVFDDEGRMLSGWQTRDDDKDLYYLGDENEGWAYTGWQYLNVSEDLEDTYDDDEQWFYFKPSNGKAYFNARKYINGKYYSFDEEGVMENKWLVGTPSAPASDSHAHYDPEIGYQGTGWVLAYEDKTNEDEEDQSWYYLNSKGVPYNENNEDGVGTASKKDNEIWKASTSGFAAKVIKSKTYLFDKEGRMQKGVFDLTDVPCMGRSTDLNGVYYFNKTSGSVEGQMTTGKQTVTYDGDNYYFNFDKTGKAYTAQIADGSYYDINGERVNAEDGNSYSFVPATELELDDAGELDIKGKPSVNPKEGIVVSSSGKVKQSGSVKIDGYKYEVTGYAVTKITEVD